MRGVGEGKSNRDAIYASLKDGGWSTRDAERFRHIMCQYPMSLPQRRTLLIDRLTRELPHKTRAEIVSITQQLRNIIEEPQPLPFSLRSVKKPGTALSHTITRRCLR